MISEGWYSYKHVGGLSDGHGCGGEGSNLGSFRETVDHIIFIYCSSFGNVPAFLGTMLLMYLCHKPSIA
jgi:hypothetical protein